MRTPRQNLRRMHGSRRFGWSIGLLFLVVLLARPAAAGDFTGPDGDVFEPFAANKRLSDADLAELRGGFLGLSGIRFFSFEVTTLVNGLPFDDFALTMSEDGGLTFLTPLSNDVVRGTRQVVSRLQLGEGNSAPLFFSGGRGFFNVIQNSLNDIVIQQNARIRFDLSGSGLSNAAVGQSLFGAALLDLR